MSVNSTISLASGSTPLNMSKILQTTVSCSQKKHVDVQYGLPTQGPWSPGGHEVLSGLPWSSMKMVTSNLSPTVPTYNYLSHINNISKSDHVLYLLTPSHCPQLVLTESEKMTVAEWDHGDFYILVESHRMKKTRKHCYRGWNLNVILRQRNST